MTIAPKSFSEDLAPDDDTEGAMESGGRKFAIVSHSHPSISKGGAEIAAYSLFTGLRAMGEDAILISGCPEHLRPSLQMGPHEFAVFYEPERYDHFYHIAPASVNQQVSDILRDQEVDLVNFHHYFNLGVDVVRETAHNISTVFTFHEFLAMCHHHGQMITRNGHILCETSNPKACVDCFPEQSRQQFAIRRSNFLDAFSEVDAFISPSRFLAGRYAAWGLGEDRLGVIENGLAAVPARPEQEVRPENRPWTFGFFGQINPFKGLGLVLDACALIEERKELAARIRIRLHGNIVGQSEAFVEQLNAALERYPFLTYFGPYDNAQVNRLMRACDYVMIPSTWWENSPTVIQEAYAAGRPVIATGIGGMAEKVIHESTGLHFAHNDPGDFVSALERAASSEAFEQLQIDLPAVLNSVQMAERYMDVFNRVESRAATMRRV